MTPSTSLSGTDLTVATLRNVLEKSIKQSTDGDSWRALTQLCLVQQAQQRNGGNWQAAAAQRVLEDVLAALEPEHPNHAKLLRLRFIDNETVYQVANEFNIADSTLYVRQREALNEFTQILYKQEIAARKALSHARLARLEPATYTKLIGVDAALDELWAILMARDAPWVITIEGIGGIGKTSLADALTRRALYNTHFADIAWVTARQEQWTFDGTTQPLDRPALTREALINTILTQLSRDSFDHYAWPLERKLHVLRNRLKEQPHMIVIDNLETFPDVKHLVPMLQGLCNPTKFLLTARERYLVTPGIFHYTVPELSITDTLILIRQEAEVSNLPHLSSASDADLQTIYDTVGGNPLAIRLIVGQAHFHSLQTILENFRLWRGQHTANFYDFIFRWAWDQLDDIARRVWLELPLVTSQRATLDYLSEAIGLDIEPLQVALMQLVQLNLVNCDGDLNRRRYTLHNLTRTFLLTEVAQWYPSSTHPN